eukprot:71809-Chlamydomonas_euryale.AAC.4
MLGRSEGPGSSWPACGRGHTDATTRACATAAVDGGERAIIFDRFRGVLEDPVSEGTHFRVPWVQTPYIMDIRTRPRTINSITGTKGKASSRGCCDARLPSASSVCDSTATSYPWRAPSASWRAARRNAAAKLPPI